MRINITKKFVIENYNVQSCDKRDNPASSSAEAVFEPIDSYICGEFRPRDHSENANDAFLTLALWAHNIPNMLLLPFGFYAFSSDSPQWIFDVKGKMEFFSSTLFGYCIGEYNLIS